MNELYPIKFKPILKEKIWGGTKINDVLNIDIDSLENCGEAWLLSGIDMDNSIVANGFLTNNELSEVLEIYMGDLVGDSVYNKFGNEFPLLIKFIDAKETLSVQVHPNDEMAEKYHNCSGKTEMWYIIQADKDAKIIHGLKPNIDKNTLINAVKNNNIESTLNIDNSNNGDVYYVPSGCVHAIGSGNLLLEIQQSSDITYRMFDWNRKDEQGNYRELHLEKAIEAIDFEIKIDSKQNFSKHNQPFSEVINCDFFTVNKLSFNNQVDKDLISIDSFVIYICIEGKCEIKTNSSLTEICKGELVLIPAEIKNIMLKPFDKCELIEVYLSYEQ